MANRSWPPWARACPTGRLLCVTALRNSLTAVVTWLGMRFAVMLGGVVLVETLFALPGMGSYIFEAVSSRDYPVIQAYILFLGTAVITVNLGADWLVRLIDRRGAVSGMR